MTHLGFRMLPSAIVLSGVMCGACTTAAKSNKDFDMYRPLNDNQVVSRHCFEENVEVLGMSSKQDWVNEKEIVLVPGPVLVSKTSLHHEPLDRKSCPPNDELLKAGDKLSFRVEPNTDNLHVTLERPSTGQFAIKDAQVSPSPAELPLLYWTVTESDVAYYFFLAEKFNTERPPKRVKFYYIAAFDSRCGEPQPPKALEPLGDLPQQCKYDHSQDKETDVGGGGEKK